MPDWPRRCACVSGKDFGSDREAWLKWWMEKRGYTYIAPKDRDKATFNVQVALPYLLASGPARVMNGNTISNPGYCIILDHEKGAPPKTGQCLAAGTLVLTPAGVKTIESLQCGDRVMSGPDADGVRHAETIAAVQQSTASTTLRLRVGGDSIVTTASHPFAKAGHGWIRAGDLRAGDQILSASSPMRIEAISPEPAQRVWNLKLTEGHSYLVGETRLVVHDGSPIPVADR